MGNDHSNLQAAQTKEVVTVLQEHFVTMFATFNPTKDSFATFLAQGETFTSVADLLVRHLTIILFLANGRSVERELSGSGQKFEGGVGAAAASDAQGQGSWGRGGSAQM